MPTKRKRYADACRHYGFDFRAAAREERRTGVVQKCCGCGMIIHAAAAVR
jgi:hypothetical protein